MGDPKKPRKKYSSPKHPWRGVQLSQELFLVGTYGLRNKRELWRAQTELSRIRKQARMLLAAPPEIRASAEPKLLTSLSRRGLVPEGASLDDVLSLTIENLLERRLQSVVWRKGLASSPYQSRQMVTHGHITLGDRVITIPSYVVEREEEGTVHLREDSPIAKLVAVKSAESTSEA